MVLRTDTILYVLAAKLGSIRVLIRLKKAGSGFLLGASQRRRQHTVRIQDDFGVCGYGTWKLYPQA